MSSTTPINEIIPFKQYVAAPGATSFAYNWWLGSVDDLSVYKNGVLQVSGYTPSAVQEPTGGNVVFSTPMVGGEVITLLGDFDIERLTGYISGGSFRAESLNLELSTHIAIMLQLSRDIRRSLRLAATSASNPDLLIMPEPEDGKFMVWNGTMGALRNSTATVEVLEAAAAIVAADIVNIDIVVANLADLLIVAGNIVKIITVADNIADVNTVADNIAAVITCANNLAAILAAPAQAAAAASAAVSAAASALSAAMVDTAGLATLSQRASGITKAFNAANLNKFPDPDFLFAANTSLANIPYTVTAANGNGAITVVRGRRCLQLNGGGGLAKPWTCFLPLADYGLAIGDVISLGVNLMGKVLTTAGSGQLILRQYDVSNTLLQTDTANSVALARPFGEPLVITGVTIVATCTYITYTLSAANSEQAKFGEPVLALGDAAEWTPNTMQSYKSLITQDALQYSANYAVNPNLWPSTNGGFAGVTFSLAGTGTQSQIGQNGWNVFQQVNQRSDAVVLTLASLGLVPGDYMSLLFSIQEKVGTANAQLQIRFRDASNASLALYICTTNDVIKASDPRAISVPRLLIPATTNNVVVTFINNATGTISWGTPCIRKGDRPYYVPPILPLVYSTPAMIMYPSQMWMVAGRGLPLYGENLIDTKNVNTLAYKLSVGTVNATSPKRPYAAVINRDSIELDTARMGTQLLFTLQNQGDNHGVMNQRTVNVNISPATKTAGTAVRMMGFGDSLTNRNVLGKLRDKLFAAGVTNVKMLGTRQNTGLTNPDRGEGREGWRFADFIFAQTTYAPVTAGTEATYYSTGTTSVTTNPFVFLYDSLTDNPADTRNLYNFNFAKYLARFNAASSGLLDAANPPDIVSIALGTNDIAGQFANVALQNSYDGLDIMIRSIRACATAAGKITKIIIIPPHGYNDQRWTAFYQILRKFIYQNYGSSQASNIWVLDPMPHMEPIGLWPITGAATDAGTQSQTGSRTDEIHWGDLGQEQMAETMFGFVMNQV